MFRILVVEDDPSTLQQLRLLLLEMIQGSQVDTAENVVTGIGKFREAYEARASYDAVVLDFKLPTTPGENPEVDSTICQEIVRTRPDTLVVHITAYPLDNEIEKHLQAVHLEQIGPRVVFLSKLDLDWSEQLVKRLRSFLYGRRIEQQFDQLFVAPAGEAGARFRPRYAGGITHPLAALSRDIIAHWEEIDEALQRKIKRQMYVVKTPDGIRVSLLEPER